MKRIGKNRTAGYFTQQVRPAHRSGRHLYHKGGARIIHRSRVKIKELKSGHFSSAHLCHYRGHCLYVEGHARLLPGSEIYLGIENSPFTPYANVYDVYRARVLCLRHLNGMPYRYGYDLELNVTP